jgi:hypothetical protein
MFSAGLFSPAVDGSQGHTISPTARSYLQSPPGASPEGRVQVWGNGTAEGRLFSGG